MGELELAADEASGGSNRGLISLLHPAEHDASGALYYEFCQSAKSADSTQTQGVAARAPGATAFFVWNDPPL
jgi:hypothetical protein